jgi:hypothetical protein
LQRRWSDDLPDILDRDARLAERKQEQTIDVASQTLYVGSRPLGKQSGTRGINRGTGGSHPVLDPALGIRLV